MDSLGAAVAVMDAMMLRTKLPDSVQMTTTVFGLPRSGNQQWADFVDKTVSHGISSFCSASTKQASGDT